MKVTELIFRREDFKKCICMNLKSQDAAFVERFKQIKSADNDAESIKKICKIDVNKMQRQEIIECTKLFDFCPKCGKVFFKDIFPFDSSKCNKNSLNASNPATRLNASNPATNVTVFNALKYQCICIYNQLQNESEEDVLYILKLICCKLLEHINNGITYNENGKFAYEPFTTKKIENTCNAVYGSIFSNRNFTVRTYAGDNISMDFCLNRNKDSKLNSNNRFKAERFSNQQMSNYIDNYIKKIGKNPTIDELTLFVCEEIMDEHQHDENLSYIKYLPSRNVIWYYINKFNLAGKLDVRMRSRKNTAKVKD